jgi:hypothetical protein
MAASTVWIPIADGPLPRTAVAAFALEASGYCPGRDFRVTRNGLVVDARLRDEIAVAMRMIAPRPPALASTEPRSGFNR